MNQLACLPDPVSTNLPTIRVLQISDLWVTRDYTPQGAKAAVRQLKGRIAADTDRKGRDAAPKERSQTQVHYIVVCGNLTRSGTAEEFAAAHAVFRQLATLLPALGPSEEPADRANRLLIVPGRQDVPKDDWTIFLQFYKQLYQDLFGITDDRSAEWGPDPCAPQAWVRDLRELTAIGMPVWCAAEDDPDGPEDRRRRAELFRETLVEACERLAPVTYSCYTPSLLVSAVSPLFCPFGREELDEEGVGEVVERLAPDLHLFGQSPVVCLRSEPYVFRHTALSTGPVAGSNGNDWPDRANLVEFWPAAEAERRPYLRIRRYERPQRTWRPPCELTNGGWDSEFRQERRAGPPADLPELIEHAAFYQELRGRIRQGERVIRMDCLPGTGIPYTLRRLAQRQGVQDLLPDWPVFVAYAAVQGRADVPGVERERDQMGELGGHQFELDQFPGLRRIRKELQAALGKFRQADHPTAQILLVMWDDGPEEDLPRSRSWTERLRQEIVDFIAPAVAPPAAGAPTGPADPGVSARTVFLYLRRLGRPRAVEFPTEPGFNVGLMNPVPYAPLLNWQPSAAGANPEPLTAVVPIDRRELGALSGGYLGLAARYIRQARKVLAGGPGSRPIRPTADEVLSDPGPELRREWEDFRLVLEASSPLPVLGAGPGQAVPWERPSVAKYFGAFVRRRLDRLLLPGSLPAGAAWPPVEFTSQELREVAPRVTAGEWEFLQDCLLDHHVIRRVGRTRHRFQVMVLAPFVRAPQRFPIFFSFSQGAGHVGRLKELFDHLQTEWGMIRAGEGFLDLWAYNNEQYGRTGATVDIFRREAQLRNNIIVLYTSRTQFTGAHACVEEVKTWWRSWTAEADEVRNQASFTHLYCEPETGQSDEEADLGDSLHHGKVRLRLPPGETLSTTNAAALVERLRPDLDRVAKPRAGRT
jgi:hypothetical protein